MERGTGAARHQPAAALSTTAFAPLRCCRLALPRRTAKLCRFPRRAAPRVLLLLRYWKTREKSGRACAVAASLCAALCMNGDGQDMVDALICCWMTAA